GSPCSASLTICRKRRQQFRPRLPHLEATTFAPSSSSHTDSTTSVSGSWPTCCQALVRACQDRRTSSFFSENVWILSTQRRGPSHETAWIRSKPRLNQGLRSWADQARSS